jgi:hypothetical protein
LPAFAYMYGAMSTGVMLGPISAIEVARTSIKLRDPDLKLAGAVIRYTLSL